MKAPEIVQRETPILHEVAKPVPESLFATPELKKIIDDMALALDGEVDGVAIAAPQIGIPYRIFLARYDRIAPPPAEGEPELAPDVGVFINPEFVKTSRKRVELEEGCLSVRGIYGKTLRHERATVRARREDGSTFERGGGGILAQLFQHEIDHLDGILFIDHAHELRKSHKDEADAAEETEADAALAA